MAPATASEDLNVELQDTVRQLTIARGMNENSPINIIVANTDLVITYVNPASVNTLRKLQHLLPIPVDKIVGQSVDIFHKRPEHQRQLLGNPRNLPHRATIALGAEKLDLLVSPIYDEKNQYVGPMVTWEIVTEKLRQQEIERDFGGQIAAISRASGDRVQPRWHHYQGKRQLSQRDGLSP